MLRHKQRRHSRTYHTDANLEMGSLRAWLELQGSNFTDHTPSLPLEELLRLIPARGDELRLRLDGVGIFQSNSRLARGLHFNPRRDALYHIVVGGREREQCGDERHCSDRARKAPPGPRRPAGAAVPAKTVAFVNAQPAAAAAQSFHAFCTRRASLLCSLLCARQAAPTTGLFALQPAGARRAAQIAYFAH